MCSDNFPRVEIFGLLIPKLSLVSPPVAGDGGDVDWCIIYVSLPM